ncbi:autotransporter-associated beta strand repeat-containing protein [Bosea sp. 2KB_26]|uniref:autotransporter-associated beta strand repeat-containing protein n=2 Tax=Pseudomonadota TaxID=1224 RepID=UPI003F9143B8
MPSHLKHSLRHTTALVAPRLRPAAKALATGVITGALLLQPGQVLAADRTWNGPGTDFNTPGNWDSGVPGNSDIAVFAGTTAPGALSTSANTSLAGIRYDAGAAAYAITLGDSLQTFGSITNSSSNTQTINVGSWAFFFYGNSSSGSNVTYALTSGNIQFRDNSVGGLSRFDTGGGGQIGLFDTADAVTLGALSGGGLISNQSASDKTLTIGGLNESTTFSGRMYSAGGAGTLAVVKEGTGTLTLTGANTYSGGTTILAGTLQVGNGGATGSITGNVVNHAALVFNRSDIFTFAGNINGTGSVTHSGGGTLTLTGANGWTGGTIITNGSMLVIGNGGTTGSITGNVVNHAELVFNRSDNVTFAGNINGTGFVIQSGGTLTLTGANGWTGGTIISVGTLQIGNGGTTGSITSNVLNNAALVFNRSDSVTFAGNINGTGSVTQSGGGTLTLTGGANGWTGGTTITIGSTLQIGNGGATGSLGSGAVTNGGILAFNRNNMQIVSNTISGGGELRQLGTGTTILTGTNTYGGGTTISAGTLQVGDGGATGTLGSGAVNNGGALVFNRAGQVTQTGAISGSGTLRKEGTGELVLTGSHSYSGATTVNAGTLSVNGVLSASSQVTVNPGGTLGGNGTVTTTQINGGTLSPGNSVGTIAIGGNLSFTAGSTYRAEIQGATADRADVAGTASLAGTLQLVGLGGSYRFSSPYTLLSATGGLGGTRFDTIANPFGDGVIVTVGYTSGDVQLTLAPKPLTPPEPGPTPPVPTPPPAGPRIIGVTAPANAYAIAKSIDKALANGGDPSSLFGVYNLPAASIPAAVNSLSGEIHSAAPAMAHIASDQFLRTMLDPMAAGRLEAGSAGPGAAAFSGLVRKGADRPAGPARLDAPFYSVWGSAYGSYGGTDGNAAVGAAKRTIDSAHVATGLDIRLMPGTVAGIAVSGGMARASLPGVLGNIDADVFQAGLYGVTRLGPVKLGGAVSYARLDNDVRRSIPALGSSLASSYDTTAWSGRLQASPALLEWNGLSLSPLAALQATRARSPAVTEANWSGASAGALALARRSDVTSRSELGLQLDADSVLAGVPVTGYVRAAWAHYFQRDAGLTASLTGLPGASFAVTGAEIGRNSALVSAGVAAKLSERVSLGLNLDGELSDPGSRIGGSAQLRVSF